MPSSYPTPASKWHAVQHRSGAADGHFVYAVRTTKIYCRPVCTARLARRGNVKFFDQPQEAERAGYRACKRCKPQVQDGLMPESESRTRVREVIKAEMDRQVQGREGRENGGEGGDAGTGDADKTRTTGGLATKARVSKWHFHRTFKKITGETPAGYFDRERPLRSDRSVVPSVQQESRMDTPVDSRPSAFDFSETSSSTPGLVGGDMFTDSVNWPQPDDEFFFDMPVQDDGMASCWLGDLPSPDLTDNNSHTWNISNERGFPEYLRR